MREGPALRGPRERRWIWCGSQIKLGLIEPQAFDEAIALGRARGDSDWPRLSDGFGEPGLEVLGVAWDPGAAVLAIHQQVDIAVYRAGAAIA